MAQRSGWTPAYDPRNLADLSGAALPNPLHKSRDGLYALYADLLREHDIAVAFGGLRLRAFDSTTAQEPDRTGSLWRLHYGVGLPSLCCDLFNLAAAAWGGGGESFTQFPIRPGDYVLADRDHSTAVGIRHVILVGCHVIVRANPDPPLPPQMTARLPTPVEPMGHERLAHAPHQRRLVGVRFPRANVQRRAAQPQQSALQAQPRL